ncbi:MAG: hypothetical protein LUG61_00340 [Lachnospiraceae bacterium]|nr:hypothetical protein [Lachnospiraceae bacterium]
MGLNEQFKKWVDKRTKRQREEEVLNRNWWHSRGYHKYFEGYSEYYIMKPNGKTKIERIYTGLYYRAAVGRSKYIFLKIFYPLMWLILAFLFITASAASVSSNFVWYTALPVALFIPVLFYLAMAILSYIICRPKMEIRQYRSGSLALIKSLPIGTVFCLLAAIATLVYMLINRSSAKESLASLVKFVLCAAIQILLFFTERNIEYDTVINENKVPDYGFEIQ